MKLSKTQEKLLARAKESPRRLVTPSGNRELNAAVGLVNAGTLKVHSEHRGMYYRNRGTGRCRYSQQVYYVETTYKLVDNA
jgi:hypothetical protein